MTPPVRPGALPWRDRLLTHWRAHGWRGFHRLRALLPAATPGPLLVATCYGTRFRLFPGDEIDSHVIREGFYESEVIEALRPALASPGAVLWVVGANFGLHAVTAKCLHPAAQVIAFEPSPAMGARLLENCALNRMPVTLHTSALGDGEAILPFHANASGNPGMSTLHPVGGFSYDHEFRVAVLTAAAVIDRGLAPAPTALLVDAEGAETAVLRGFGRHLTAPALRLVVFEAGNDFLETRQPAALHACVTDAGFRLEKLTRREETAHTLSNFLARRA